jgi:hypothetical protein
MIKMGMNQTVSDQAIHLDLVAKSRGIAAAENYFIGLPKSSKNHLYYAGFLYIQYQDEGFCCCQ